MNMKQTFFILLLFTLVPALIFAQGVGINTDNTTADPSAMLDVKSTTKGALVPRMTMTQRDAIATPIATSLLIFQTDNTPGYYYYNGAAWQPIAPTFVEVDGSITNEIELPTTANPGDMNYWNGTAWVVVAATPNEGAALQMIGGVPTWVGGTVPAFLPVTTGTGRIWMDRNLGALQVATSSTDHLAYGDLYQWGRLADGHETIVWTSSTTSDGAEQLNETATLSSADNPGHGNFITANSGWYDWRSPKNNNLWQGVSGINNPCPTGFRIPTAAELDAERATFLPQNSAGAFASPLKLPAAGYRQMQAGLLISQGISGSYWTSHISTYNFADSGLLRFDASSASMNGGLYRALGFSVRCIKD
jgi:hypothetical protein